MEVRIQVEPGSELPRGGKRRPVGCLVALLCILFGMIAFAIYEIESRKVPGSDAYERENREEELRLEDERVNTPRDEREAERARRQGTLRDDE